MKSALLIVSLSLVSLNSFAGEKICFGFKNSDTNGAHFTAEIGKNKIAVSGGDYEGTYARSKAASVNGKDGHTYLNYDVDGSDGCNTLLVDEALLEADGVGQMKFRCRGEGFGDSKFFCRNK